MEVTGCGGMGVYVLGWVVCVSEFWTCGMVYLFICYTHSCHSKHEYSVFISIWLKSELICCETAIDTIAIMFLSLHGTPWRRLFFAGKGTASKTTRYT